MACLPEELFEVVNCKVASSMIKCVQLARLGGRMRSDEKKCLLMLNGARMEMDGDF
jgi:hypothetical protein